MIETVGILKPVDTTTEKKILTGLIVSTRFCTEVLPTLHLEWFETSFLRTIIRWIKTYYDKYKQAPMGHIKDLFESNRRRLKGDVASLIEQFLTQLSENYVLDEENKEFNVNYYIDIAFNYFRERSLQNHLSMVKELLDQGKREEAGREVENFRQLQREIYPYATLTNKEALERVTERMHKEDENPFFAYYGKLGNMMGPLRRGWLASFMGPLKRGKSFFLLETAYQSMLNNMKCLFVTLEMSSDEVYERMLKRLTSCNEVGGVFQYPVFDCVFNQDGSCTKPQRLGKVKLINDSGFKPPYNNAPNSYVPCDVCRKGNSSHYKPESWFQPLRRTNLDYALAERTLDGLDRTHRIGHTFRLLAFPTFTANLGKIKTYLAQWEDLDGWVPDVIVIDYADILAPEDESETGRDRIDHTWKELKSMASSRQCLVVTATQANRESIEKFVVKQIHASEDIRKLAHVDIMLALNQTPEEKGMGIMRIGVIAHRHRHFIEASSVTVLQQLEVGQPYLDSEFGVIDQPKITKRKGK